MATQHERDQLASLDKRMTTIEVTLEKVIVPTLSKVDQFVDDNKSGIRTASLLDNKIVTVFIAAIIIAGVYFLGKATGGGL